MDIKKFNLLLNSFMEESGMSQTQLSVEAEVPQSQVSAWSNGKGVRVSKNCIKVKKFIENYRKNSKEYMLPEEVENAVKEFVGTSKERALILTQMIKSLQPLVDGTDVKI